MHLRHLHEAIDYCIGKLIVLIEVGVRHLVSPASCREYFGILLTHKFHRLSNDFVKLHFCIIFVQGQAAEVSLNHPQNILHSFARKLTVVFGGYQQIDF